ASAFFAAELDRPAR
ncbi:transposase, partial [Mycobacterium tuberculosis Wt 21419]